MISPFAVVVVTGCNGSSVGLSLRPLAPGTEKESGEEEDAEFDAVAADLWGDWRARVTGPL